MYIHIDTKSTFNCQSGHLYMSVLAPLSRVQTFSEDLSGDRKIGQEPFKGRVCVTEGGFINYPHKSTPTDKKCSRTHTDYDVHIHNLEQEKNEKH